MKRQGKLGTFFVRYLLFLHVFVSTLLLLNGLCQFTCPTIGAEINESNIGLAFSSARFHTVST